MIAMALALDPEVLIADEPTTALDVTVQAQIMGLLAELQQQRNMGLILITHDMGVVADVADRISVMYAGKVVEEAPVYDIYARPAHPYTKALLESIPAARHEGPAAQRHQGPAAGADRHPAGLRVQPALRLRPGRVPAGPGAAAVRRRAGPYVAGATSGGRSSANE